MRGGIPRALNRYTSDTCAIFGGEDNFDESLISHTDHPEGTRLK